MQQALHCRVSLPCKFSSSQRKMHQASPVPTAVTFILFPWTQAWVVTDPPLLMLTASEGLQLFVCRFCKVHVYSQSANMLLCVHLCVSKYTHVAPRKIYKCILCVFGHTCPYTSALNISTTHIFIYICPHSNIHNFYIP